MSVALIAFVSCPSDVADSLASALVEARVAACVSVLPHIVSTYRWNGAVQRDAESLLLIKTTAVCFEDLRREVLAHHPYELPEVIAVDVACGHAPYLEWIAANTAPHPQPTP